MDPIDDLQKRVDTLEREATRARRGEGGQTYLIWHGAQAEVPVLASTPAPGHGFVRDGATGLYVPV